jgi:hypothetical protein
MISMMTNATMNIVAFEKRMEILKLGMDIFNSANDVLMVDSTVWKILDVNCVENQMPMISSVLCVIDSSGITMMMINTTMMTNTMMMTSMIESTKMIENIMMMMTSMIENTRMIESIMMMMTNTGKTTQTNMTENTKIMMTNTMIESIMMTNTTKITTNMIRIMMIKMTRTSAKMTTAARNGRRIMIHMVMMIVNMTETVKDGVESIVLQRKDADGAERAGNMETFPSLFARNIIGNHVRYQLFKIIFVMFFLGSIE